MVTRAWLKKYPNTAAAFRRRLLKAQAIAATDPAPCEQGMVKYAGIADADGGDRERAAVPDPAERQRCSSGWRT